MAVEKLGRVVVAVALLTVLGACSTDSPTANAGGSRVQASETTPTPTGPSAGYVALGDSFTAGPGISPEQDDAGLCRRSGRDWPMLAAAALGQEVTDLSCAGATTADLKATATSGVLGPDTDLVTVSAGGNDGGLFLSLLKACTTDAATCRSYTDTMLPPVLATTTADLAALLTSVGTDAPAATVVLVGYPRIMPSAGTCDSLGVAADDAALVSGAEGALDAALADAAERADVPYVSLRAPSQGHDACAGDQSWTNGLVAAPGDGILFHPNARGMAGVGDLVAAAVRDRVAATDQP